MDEYIAHLRQSETGEWAFQPLEDHLHGTAVFAERFASKFGDGQWGFLLGHWHDVGKFSQSFQQYIRKHSGYDETSTDSGKTDHTSAGAILSVESLKSAGYSDALAIMAAYSIAGHHSGLLNWWHDLGVAGSLQARLQKKSLFDEIKSATHQFLQDEIPTTKACNGRLTCNRHLNLWVRMLFSCLIDADRLDTERFMQPNRFNERGAYPHIRDLKTRFDLFVEDLQQKSDQKPLNTIRNKILHACLVKGAYDSGIFSLTVPTGGGKTLASMGWALTHAIQQNKDRIIIAIPYTSIITQTVDIFRQIFGEENVVEHHSDVDASRETMKGKLAAENWDAPIIVTTNVQLFESLYSSKTSRCRKLHNIVNSIIILDEVQALPSEFLRPILDVLRSLHECFDVSFLLSTATQPALIGTIGAQEAAFSGLNKEDVSEIVENVSMPKEILQRVQVEMPSDDNPLEWDELAEHLLQYEQVLCVVNTRIDCKTLFELLPEGTIHLSRMMCSEHISKTIRSIKALLDLDNPVRVISTQLIEAGVDIDFPVFFRAFAGLDSIVQSAGRCNREGRMNTLGKVVVFNSPGNIPPGFMRKGSDATREMMPLENTSIQSPETFEHYFHILYGKVKSFDIAGIEEFLVKDSQSMRFQFATASRNFKLIRDEAISVFVWYEKGIDLIRKLGEEGPSKRLLKLLQRYSVSLRKNDFEKAAKMKLIENINGYWCQASDLLYDNRIGVKLDDDWGSETSIV